MIRYRYVKSWRERYLVRGNSKCKGFGVGMCLGVLRNRKKVSVVK